MKSPQNLVITAMAVLLAAGCSATHHAQDVRAADDTDRITVGTVQKEITLGMSAADVAAVLGSPNIVTTEEERQDILMSYHEKLTSDQALVHQPEQADTECESDKPRLLLLDCTHKVVTSRLFWRVLCDLRYDKLPRARTHFWVVHA